jgi:aryl-alcohol dehydrogenase-like predicted oxidoreductase
MTRLHHLNSRIGLGSVQFGLDYGISNKSGQVTANIAKPIIERAADAGIRVLDTAACYGESETVLGRIVGGAARFRIVTKTPSATGDVISVEHVKDFESAFKASRDRLRKERVYGLLVHHGSDLLKPGGERLIRFLECQKAEDRTAKIGVSVYSGQEIDQILSLFTPDIVQLPFNLADRRLVKSGHLAKLKNLGVEIHARSLFLQGLLLMEIDELPAQFQPIKKELSRFSDSARTGGLSALEACLYAGLSQPELDILVVGVTKISELEQIIEACTRTDQLTDDPDLYYPDIQNSRFLDPSQWQSI